MISRSSSSSSSFSSLLILVLSLLGFRTFSNNSVIVSAEGLFCPDFSSSSLTKVRPSSVSMFVYRLETSNVSRRQFLGSLPNARNRLMNSVVSRM